MPGRLLFLAPPLSPRGEQIPRPPLTPRGEQIPPLEPLPVPKIIRSPTSPTPEEERRAERERERIEQERIDRRSPQRPSNVHMDDQVALLIFLLTRKLGPKKPSYQPPPPLPQTRWPRVPPKLSPRPLPLPQPEILPPKLPEYTPRFKPEDFDPYQPKTDVLPEAELPKPTPPTEKMPIPIIPPPPPPLPPVKLSSTQRRMQKAERDILESRLRSDLATAATSSSASLQHTSA